MQIKLNRIQVYLPSRSSPKLPQPIFFPTRKLGPTMSRFDVEVTLCREVCMLGLAALPLVREALLPASCSRSLSLSLARWGSLSALPSLPSFFCMAMLCCLSGAGLSSGRLMSRGVSLLSGSVSVLSVVGARQQRLVRPHHT